MAKKRNNIFDPLTTPLPWELDPSLLIRGGRWPVEKAKARQAKIAATLKRKRRRRMVEKQKARAAAERAAKPPRKGARLHGPIPKGRRPLDPECGPATLLRAMAPGGWYALPDLGAMLPDAPPNSVKAWLYQRLAPRGLVERAINADRAPGDLSGVPRYLWRLTPAGETEREVQLLLA